MPPMCDLRRRAPNFVKQNDEPNSEDEWCDEVDGTTPSTARETRALPILTSESRFDKSCVLMQVSPARTPSLHLRFRETVVGVFLKRGSVG